MDPAQRAQVESDASERAAGRQPDFRGLDFDSLWRGRGKVTEVERRILSLALGPIRYGRVLEIGTGSGRLAPVVRAHSDEYVASDVTPQFLQSLPRSLRPDLRVAANVYRLPFASAAFSAVVMIRVHNFLEHPGRAFREIARVLVPGGTFVLTYNPKPSVATVVDDLKVLLRRAPGTRFRSMTLDPRPMVPVNPSSFPAWVSTRARVAQTLAAAGFEPRTEYGTGLEDYRGLRRLPADWFARAAVSFADAGGFPTRFSAQRRPGVLGAPARSLDEILICPKCGHPLAPFGVNGERVVCSSCGRRADIASGVLDLRSDPP